MKILCLNVGSTSVKCCGFDFPSEKILFEKKYETKKFKSKDPYQEIFSDLLNQVSQYQWDKIAHRFVHGMWPVEQPLLLKPKLIPGMKKWNSLLPLHLSFNIAGYQASRNIFSEADHYAVFDHACFQEMDDVDSIFALPQKYIKKYHLRRFGYHGLSHEYSAFEISKKLKISLKRLKLISCHLGGGSSISAFQKGKFVDTSMDMSALSGLPMTTRSGTIDPGVLFRILRDGKESVEKIEDDFYKKSGLKAIYGKTGDMRVLLENYNQDEKAKLAVDHYVSKIVKMIAGFYVNLNGAHVLSFTGGIGENSSLLRKMILRKLKVLDFQNKLLVEVIPCKEELHMARLVFGS